MFLSIFFKSGFKGQQIFANYSEDQGQIIISATHIGAGVDIKRLSSDQPNRLYRVLGKLGHRSASWGHEVFSVLHSLSCIF